MPRFRPGKKQKSGTNNAAFAAAKAATDAAVACTGVNPAPMGRPWPTKEAAAAPELLSPAHSSEKRAADMALGKDAGLISALKRSRPAQGAYAEEDAAECSPLQYVTVNEAEVRTAIKVLYVHTLDAPPESEWKGNDGTINIIRNTLGVHYGTVHDVLLRCTAAEENKMNVDVGERFSNGTGRRVAS